MPRVEIVNALPDGYQRHILELADGASVQGFICESLATQGAQDITHLGGWRAYVSR